MFIVVSCLMCIVVVVLCVLLSSYVYLLYYMCIALFTLDVGILARNQYSEGPATGHLDTSFSWFPCVYKQMLRYFPRFQVATTCFSCSPADLNLLVGYSKSKCRLRISLAHPRDCQFAHVQWLPLSIEKPHSPFREIRIMFIFVAVR